MKVAIIGAGINGLYLAWRLSEKGEEVSVFERKNSIGKQACSGLFSERILEFIPESESLIQNHIKSAVIHFPKKTIKVEFSKKFFVMSHFKLDNLVAELAKKAGVKIIINRDISLLECNAFVNKYDRVIGCDGPNSIVRKSLNLPNPNYRLAIQGFVSSREQNSSNYVETWPIKNGFIWKIPRGQELMYNESSMIEYGIIGNPKETKERFSEFLSENNLKLEKIESALVPQGFSVPLTPNITLCGDSAGLTKPWSGGGVVWGLVAAGMLLKDFPDFSKYRNNMKRFFLRRIMFSKIATAVAYFIGFKMPWILPKKIKIESDFLF